MLCYKRGTRIVWVIIAGLLCVRMSSPVHAETPGCPENAAVLYFQAFDSIPDLTAEEYAAQDAVIRDHAARPDALSSLVAKWQTSLDLARTASRIAYCDWGHVYSQGVAAYTASTHFAELRKLVFAMYAEAVAHAHDGQQEAALENGLTLQRIAAHTGHDSLIAHLMAVAVEGYAAKTLRVALGYGSASAETLSRVQGQWITRTSSVSSCFVAFDNELRLLESTVSQPDFLASVRDEPNIAEHPGHMDQMSDAALVAHMMGPYRKLISDMKRVMALDMAHTEKEAEVEALSAGTAQIYKDNFPRAIRGYFSAGPAHFRTYTLSVRNDATVAATQLAIELYDTLMQTGELPLVLPPYMPKDPFTQAPFEYEWLSDGFVLRFWEPDDSGKGSLVELTFHVPGMQ
jgi:hypothetical protein